MPSLLVPQYSLYCGGGETVEDAQLFMRSAYHYWLHKGFWGVFTASLVDFANALILFITAVLLTVCFRWDQASSCVDAGCSVPSLFSACHAPFIHKPTALGYCLGALVFLSTGAGAVYEAFHTLATYCVQSEVDDMVRRMGVNAGFRTPFHRLRQNWRHARLWRDDYRATESLLSDRVVLGTMSWDAFVEALCAYVTREKKLRFCANGSSWDALRAVQTLLWEDNLMISVRGSGVLERGAIRYLDTSVVRGLLPALFDPFHTVLTDLDGGVTCAAGRLHLRAVRYAQCYLAVYPFIVVFLLLKILAKNAAVLKQNLTSLKQYGWNSRARLTFRLYNEVEHLFNCRLQTAETEAIDMVSRLSVHTNLSRLVRRASSTCVLTVVAVSFLNPSLLVMGTFMGISFVWWLSISLLLFASFPKEDPRAREYNYTPQLDALTDSLYYDDPEWRKSGDAFLHHITFLFLDSVMANLMKEVLGVFCMPFVLIAASRDGSLMQLSEAVKYCCGVVDGVGSVPHGAMFDTLGESGGDEGDQDTTWNSPETDVVIEMGHPNDATAPLDVRRWSYWARSRRSEKARLSAASFMAVYEQWTLRHDADADAGENSQATAGNSGPTSLTNAVLEQWRSAFHPNALTNDARTASSTEPSADEEGASSSHTVSLTPTSSSPSGAATPSHAPQPPLESYRTERPLYSAHSSGRSALPASATLTAHEREHRLVSAVRHNDNNNRMTNRLAGMPHSPSRTPHSRGAYGAAQSARLDSHEHISASP